MRLIVADQILMTKGVRDMAIAITGFAVVFGGLLGADIINNLRK